MHKRKTTKLTNTKSCEYFYHKYETKYEEHVVKTKDKFLQTQKSQKHRQQDDIKSVLLCRALSIITTHSASVTHSTTHSTPSTHSVSHHSVSVTSHLLIHSLCLSHQSPTQSPTWPQPPTQSTTRPQSPTQSVTRSHPPTQSPTRPQSPLRKSITWNSTKAAVFSSSSDSGDDTSVSKHICDNSRVESHAL